MNPPKIYQLQIALQEFQPKIWRRILVPSDTLLPEFHITIQLAMGWYNSHLYQFILGRTLFVDASDNDALWDELGQTKYKGVRLDEVLKKENDSIVYEYDFGDSWMHDIILEKILPPDASQRLSYCLTGSMNCPPEDCGGVSGYSEYLKIRLNPKHEEHERVMEWLGKDFDPDYFNLDEINEKLVEEPDEWLDFNQ